MADLTTTIKTEAYTEAVASVGRVKAGHRALCPKCGWHSHRYDRLSTAELMRDEHLASCPSLKEG